MTPEAARESPPPRPRRVPSAFLTAVALFFLLDHFLWTSEPWLRVAERYARVTRGKALVTAGIALLPRDEVLPPILLMGSSQMREGVDCGPFEARFPGRTCRNFSVYGGAPLDVLYLARRVDHRIHRRVILTSLFPKTQTYGPKNEFTDTSTLVALAASGTVPRMPLRRATSVLEAWLMNTSESLRTKDALADLWHSVRRSPAEAWSLTLPPARPRMGRRLKRRAAEMERQLASPPERSVTYLEAQELALADVVEGERARGNLLIVIDFPTRPGFEELVPPQHRQLYRDWLDRLARRTDLVLVRHEELPPFPAEDWNDFAHLNDAGMAKMSAQLAEIVARAEGR